MAQSVHPTFIITMADGGVMSGELYPDLAPQSVGNFISLANQGFYDGLSFPRVLPGGMLQGGGPQGTGRGGPGYQIKGEFSQNGVSNPLKNSRGILSMARSMQMDSAGSQFIVMVEAAPHLDGSYAAFGKVTGGLEKADAIVETQRNRNDKPLSPQTIKTIRVDDLGQQWPFERM